MNPHPRIRKTIKWGGAVVTVLLVVVWVGSGWITFGRTTVQKMPQQPGPVYRLSQEGYTGHRWKIDSGVIVHEWGKGFVRNDAGWHHATQGFRLRLLVPYVFFPQANQIPRIALVFPDKSLIVLWPIVLVFAFPTALLWWVDARLSRPKRPHLCPKCHYDRTGLAIGAVCPECGAVPPAHI